MEEIQPVEKKQTKASLAKEIFSFALIVIVIILPIRLFVAQPFIVVGTSMEPTFLNGQYLIVDELTYHFNPPQRGDVIVFKFDSNPASSQDAPANPSDPSKYFIKRIIGLPGETVDIQNGKVTIFNNKNPEGFVLDEPYINNPPTNTIHVTVQPGDYFVMGDNRAVSFDSRSWGLLNGQKIIGRVFLRLLPPQKIGILPGNSAGDYSNEKK